MLSWFRRWRASRKAPQAEAAGGAGGAEDAEDADAGDDEPAEDAGAPSDGEEPALTDELDLHTFLPKECASVVDEYLRAAQEAGLSTVRIIHGKGTGTLRRIVHSVLERHPAVRSFQLAGASRGSWGATVVELLPPPPPPPAAP
jgi:dsDNA-specific endonuclease/ATPase MutS2